MWTPGPDMPFEMNGPIQSVAVQEIVYVGGGSTVTNDKKLYTVMGYNTYSQKWNRLPLYTTYGFAMVVLNNQLVLVGGRDRRGGDANALGVWEAGSRQWTHPYGPMPTARVWPSAVVYKQWLVVAGGKLGTNTLSAVEVLDVPSKQWCKAPPTPTPWSSMKSVLVEDVWYVMGGFESVATEKIYSLSLKTLLPQTSSTSSSETQDYTGKRISDLGLVCSTPINLTGTLLAVGGFSNNDAIHVSTIHRFLPETEKWEVAGQLPTPLSQCATSTSKGHLLVFGGNNSSHLLSKVYIGTLL